MCAVPHSDLEDYFLVIFNDGNSQTAHILCLFHTVCWTHFLNVKTGVKASFNNYFQTLCSTPVAFCHSRGRASANDAVGRRIDPSW